MRLTTLAVLVTMTTTGYAQSPVKETFAYSRATLPGIPTADSIEGGQARPIAMAYYIYVAANKKASLSVQNVWVRGKNYAATMKKVRTPVIVEHDADVPTGKKDTLVAATSSAVYQVKLTEERKCTSRDTAATKLCDENDVVVFLESGTRLWYGFVRHITELPPSRGM